MLVYIDESGDPGLPSRPGASRYLVVAAVLVERDAEELLRSRIDRLRSEIGFGPLREFRFNKLDRERRLAFLRAIDPFEYAYCASVIDKVRLTGEYATFTKDDVYIRAAEMALLTVGDMLHDATVVIDGSGSRSFRKSLSTALR